MPTSVVHFAADKFYSFKWQLPSEMIMILLKLLIYEYVVWYINVSLCILM